MNSEATQLQRNRAGNGSQLIYLPRAWLGWAHETDQVPYTVIPLSGPYQHWVLETTQLKAHRSQNLENNLGSFQRKESNRSCLSIIAGLKG